MTGSDRPPHQLIADVNRVRNDIRKMQENLRELQQQLRQLEWGRLGGLAVYDPAEAHKLFVVTAENLESLAERVDDLPKNVDANGGDRDE